MLMLSLKYTLIYYSHTTCSFKWTVLKERMISNYVVAISACIDLFHIFLQTSNKILSTLKGSITRRNRKRNIICQNINKKSGNRL